MKDKGINSPTRKRKARAVCPVAAKAIIAPIQKTTHVKSMILTMSPMNPIPSP
jgi:hypothetical protein